MGYAGGSADIVKSVYSTLFLGYQESGKFKGKVRNVANSRCLSGYVHSSHWQTREHWPRTCGIFSVRLLRCLLVLLYRAIPEPLIAGRATSTALTLFFYQMSYQEEGLGIKILNEF